MRAIFEIVLKKKWAQLADRCLNLAKMIEKRMWKSQSPLRQFKGIPEDIIKKIEKKDISWDRLYDLSPAELGEMVRYPAMGTKLYKVIHQFPRLDLN
jgi:pre-mRNA-splicing helicase BRR2